MDVATLRTLLTADSTDLDAKLAAADKKLTAFAVKDYKNVSLDVNTAGAMAKVDALAAKIADLKSKTVSITGTGGMGSRAVNPGTFNLNGQTLSFREAQGAAAAWARDIDAQAKKAGTAVDRFGNSIKSSGGLLNSFGRQVAGVATSFAAFRALSVVGNTIGGAFKTAFDYNSDLQKNLIGTTNLMHGNANAAAGLQRQLQQFALVTPFEFKDLLPLSQQLLAANVAAKDIIPTLRAAGDAASGLVRGQEGINHIVLSLAQASATGKITGETLKELRHVGVPAIQYLAASWHENTQKMADDISRGMIPAREGLAAITVGMERQFHGQMDKMSRTAEGAWSNIKDATSKILGSAFADTFQQISSLAVRIATIASNKDFQAWCKDVARYFQNGFGLAVESVEWLGSTTLKVAPFVIGALTAIGVRSLWMSRTAIAGSVSSGVQSLFSLAKAFVATGGASVVMTGVVGVALAALATDFLGIRSGLVDGWKALTTWIARQYDGVAKFLHLEGGFEASVKATLPDVDKTFAGFKSSLQAKMKGLDLSGLMPPMPDFDKWSKAAPSDASKVPAIPDFRGKYLNSESEAAKQRAAALRLEKDQLQDLIAAYSDQARAVEESARRQMSALNGLRDTFRGFFESVQERFVELGIINNPMGGWIKGFEKSLDLLRAMKGLASDTDQSLSNINAAKASAQSRLDTDQGGDGRNPQNSLSMGGTSGTASTSGAANIGGSIISQIASGIGQPRGISACAYAASKILQGIGVHITASNMARNLRLNAVAMGAREVPYSKAKAGDLINWRGAAYGANGSGNHVAVYEGGGFYSGNQGHAKRVHQPVYDLGHAHFYDTSRFANGAHPLGVPVQTLATQKMFKVKPTLSNLFGGEMFDGALTGITAVDKAWGAAVKNMDGNAVRFGLQSELSSQKFQAAIAAAAKKTGQSVPEVIKWLRAFANAADFKLSRENALQQSIDKTKELRRALLQIGHENDPLAALRESFGHERNATPQAQRQAEIAAQRAKIISDMAQATRRAANEQDGQNKALASADVFLKGNTTSMLLYQRAVELANVRLQIQSELRDQLNSVDARVAARAQSQVEARTGAASSRLDSDRLRALNVEIAGNVAALHDRAGMLRFERGLVEQNTSSTEDQAQAIEVETGRRANLQKVFAAWVPLVGQARAALIALAAAQQIANGATSQNRYAQATKNLQDYNELVRQTARGVALAGQEQGIYQGAASYSPAQERRLAMAREEDRLREENRSKHFGKSGIQDRLAQFGANFDANAQTKAIAESAQRIGEWERVASNAGDTTGRLALEFDLTKGSLSLLDEQTKASMRAWFDYSQGVNLGTDALKSAKQATFDAQRQMALSMATGSAAKMRVGFGFDDQAERTRRGLPDGAPLYDAATQSQVDDQRRAQVEMAGVQERINRYQAMFQSMNDSLRDGISGAIMGGFSHPMDSVRDIISNLSTQVQKNFADAFSQNLSDKAVGSMRHGMGGFGGMNGLPTTPGINGPLPSLVGAAAVAAQPPRLAQSHRGILGAIGGLFGIGGDKGGAGGTSMENMTINVTTANIRSTRTMVTGGLTGGLGGDNGSKPSTEQQAGKWLGVLGAFG